MLGSQGMLGGPGSPGYQNSLSQQAAMQQQAIQKALANISAMAMPEAKKEPKNEFLEKVRKIYMKRIELRIRLAMGLGGAALWALAPFVGFEVYCLWRWIGMNDFVSSMSSASIAVVILGVGGWALFAPVIDSDMIRRWARDWVDEQEGK